MFYWLFKSRREASDPLVFWLTGGPGCSSEMAVFYENGPFSINDDLTLKNNPYSWSDVSNIVFVDNPIGTGFSEVSELDHLESSEDQIAATMYLFLEGFVQANPEFKGRDFYITGESYAGHYIPAIAYYLTHNVESLSVNFKGVAIGNGWVDPYL
jgi:carboxypeptidase C (cathepsin A)